MKEKVGCRSRLTRFLNKVASVILLAGKCPEEVVPYPSFKEDRVSSFLTFIPRDALLRFKGDLSLNLRELPGERLQVLPDRQRDEEGAVDAREREDEPHIFVP